VGRARQEKWRQLLESFPLFWGVLEPLQTATTIEGQIEELNEVLKKKGNLPVTLIGWSWGAWLSFIFAAQKHRKLVFGTALSSAHFYPISTF